MSRRALLQKGNEGSLLGESEGSQSEVDGGIVSEPEPRRRVNLSQPWPGEMRKKRRTIKEAYSRYMFVAFPVELVSRSRSWLT
jgi:hypothetical protein